MTLVQLQYFYMVCKYKSIRRATEILHISQPSISNAIRDLEREYGVELFMRTNKQMVLTKEGEMLLQQAERVIKKADALTSEMACFSGRGKPIRIGIPPMIGSFLFPLIFREFKALYPDIQMEIVEHGSAYTRKQIDQEELDLALVITDEVDTKSVDIFPILTTKVVLGVHRSHPVAGLTRITFSEISRYPLVMFNNNYYLHDMVMDCFESVHAEPNVLLFSNQLYTMKHFITLGLAGAFIFPEIVTQEPEIVGVDIIPALPVHIGLIWKTGRYLHEDAVQFISFIKKFSYK